MIIEYDEKHESLDYQLEYSKFKSIFGYEIPDDYLSFLNESGTGLFPQPGFYDNLMEIGVFYDFRIDKTSDDIHNIFYANKILQKNNRITKNILAFAETPDTHNIFCLVLDGELYGKIILLGDDNILLNNGYKKTDIDEKEDILDQSFNDFISKLE